MAHLPNCDIPKYEVLMEATKRYPALDPLSMATFLQIIVAGDELFRGAGETFRDRQISKGKFMVLLQLFNKEDGSTRFLSPAEIATAVNVTRATVSGLLDGLVKDGYVLRKQDEKDRRMVLVSLTNQGIELMDQFLPVHFERIRQLMNCLSSDEKVQLRELLIKVCDHVAVIAPNRAQEECDCSL
ncbi:MAG: MarR family transcriptional regulator [Puniceicoccaceae bacterium]